MSKLSEMAEKFIREWKRPGQGPCLVAKPGSNLPSSHENDFCECDVHDAYIYGLRAGLELAAQIAEQTPCNTIPANAVRRCCEALQMATDRIRALGGDE